MREGVKLLLDIYENYGCVAASGVFICDKDEVWYVENCSGTQYVAIKLNDNMIFLEPNMAVIGRVDLDDENVIASKDLIAVAKKAGTFVGDEAKNIIDFRASYARISEKMDQRMIDGLNYLNAAYKYDSDALVADNTKFTISNLDASDKLVALYTNIKADRKLDKDDVFLHRQGQQPGDRDLPALQGSSGRDRDRGLGRRRQHVLQRVCPVLSHADRQHVLRLSGQHRVREVYD